MTTGRRFNQNILDISTDISPYFFKICLWESLSNRRSRWDKVLSPWTGNGQMKLLNENKRRKLLYKFIYKYDVYDWLTKTVKEKQLNSENRKWRWQNTHHQSNDYNPLMCFVRFLFLRSSRYKICKRRKLHEIFEINSWKKNKPHII